MLDADCEKRLTKLETWRDGNGALGAEQRLQVLEAQKEEMTCRTGQRLSKHIDYHREQEGREMTVDQWRTEMKISRRQNMIALASIAVTIILVVIFGG
jgi:hypothetical protein